MKTFEKISGRLCLAAIQGMYLTEEERFGLDQEIGEILEAIEKAPNFESAASKLQELGRFQDLLALLWYKYDAVLSDKQRQLVREYDRWDDAGVRLKTFEEIRKRRFLATGRPFHPDAF